MRRISSLVGAFILFFLISPSFVQADEIIYKKAAYCLDVNRCFGSNCGGDEIHRVRLTTPTDPSRKAPANQSKMYLTECLHIYPTKDAFDTKTPSIVCTTGNPALDAELFCGPIKSQTDLATKMKSENCNQLLRLDDDNVTWYDFGDRPGTPEYGKLQPVGIHYTIDYKFGGNMYDGNDPYRAQHHAPPGSYGMFFGSTRQNPTVPISTNESGNIVPGEVFWQSYTLWTVAREFLLWSVEEETIKSPAPAGSTQDGIGGQQQDTLAFPDVKFSQQVQSQACTPVAFDPYGRVFDAVSLEPIPLVQVELWQKDLNLNPANPDDAFSKGYALSQNPGVPNPFGTNPAGDFSFYVGDGTYKLVPSVSGYTMMTQSQAASLGPTAGRIYSNIYYSDSPPIVQAGALQQRDIPMMPEKGIGKQYNIDLIWDKEEVTGSTLIYRGRISHPFAGIQISKCATDGISETCSIYKTFWANEGGPNNLGDFTINLDQTQLIGGEYYKVTEYERRNLTQSPLTRVLDRIISWLGGKEVEAQEQQVSRTLQPIPRYLEGYVYDTQGSIVPNGLVELYTDYSPTPVFASRADETGRFIITSENIPKTSYRIVFASDQVAVEMSTSQFLQTQQEFYIAEDINAYEEVTAQNNPRRSVTPEYQPVAKISPITPNAVITQTPSEIVQENTQTQRNPLFLVGAIILLLIGGAGALLGVYVYKKRASEGM